MSKKQILIMLLICTMLLLAGCGPTVRTTCDCDCKYCDCGHDWEEEDRYGEYEGWRD